MLDIIILDSEKYLMDRPHDPEIVRHINTNMNFGHNKKENINNSVNNISFRKTPSEIECQEI